MSFDWDAWLGREEKRIAAAVSKARDLGPCCYQLCAGFEAGDISADFMRRAFRRLWWASLTGKTLEDRRQESIYDPALGGVV